MTTTSEIPRFSTLPLSKGDQPFSLSEEEMKLDGDWWAWQFLRRNPFYVRDFDLRQQVPDLLRGKANRKLLPLMGFPPQPVPNAYQRIDCRFFCAHGQVLSGPVDWPYYTPLTLKQYRLEHSELGPADVQIREFDSGSTFGIGDWFNPNLETLPQLQEGQSWFYNLVEPLWQAPDPEIKAVFTYPNHERYRKFPVGISLDTPLVKVKRAAKSATGILSNGATTEEFSGSGKLERPICFGSDTEVAFLIGLDGDIAGQLRPVRTLANAFLELHKAEGLIKSSPRDVPRNYVPHIAHPDHGISRLFVEMQATLKSLTRLPHQHRRHWRIAVIETTIDLAAQFTAIKKELESQQRTIDSAAQRTFTRIERKRNAKTDEFWLKKSLCLLELQETLLDANRGRPPGADKIAQAIFDPGHEFHHLVRPDSGLTAARPYADGQAVWHSETFKTALRKGKDFSLGLYEFLQGMTAEELRNS